MRLQPADGLGETLERGVDRYRGLQVPGMCIGNPDAAHPGTRRGLQAGRSIFENDAGLGRDTKSLGGQQEKIGRRLPAFHLVASNFDIESSHQCGLG